MTRLRGAFALGVFGLCLLVVALGRGPAEPVPHGPSLAGVVATRDFIGPRSARLVLSTGESVEIDFTTAHNLNPNLDEPDPGELLFRGVEGDRPWFATAFPSVDGGFALYSPPRGVANGSILFESGLRLPVASNYSESLTGPMEAGMPVTYLLNDRGEVTRQQ